MRRAWIGLAAALAATLAVYSRSFAGELVYDDELLIARNPLIADLANLPRLFTSAYWEFHEDARSIAYWRPLTAALHALVWRFAGVEPRAYHVLSVAVHLAATAAAFFLARRLWRSAWGATAVALFFGLHPAHVESVAWISALNDPLFGLFTLLALLAHLAWRQRGSPGIPLVPAACFALALLAKEQGTAVLPLVLALDLGRRREPHEEPGARGGLAATERAYGPLVAVLALYVLARMAVFQSPFAGFERIQADLGVSFARLQLLRLEIFGGALEILAWPHALDLFRPFRPHVSLADPRLLRAALWTALFAAALGFAWRRGRRPALAALLLIPAGFLPVLVKLEALGLFPLAERFLYVSVLGFALLLALALARLPRLGAGAAALAIAALYGARSFERIAFWHDDQTLFRRSAGRTPRSVSVQLALGRTLLEKVNATGDLDALREAFAVFERAQELLVEARQPESDLLVSSNDHLQANLGLAWCYLYEARLGADESYATAIALLERLAQEVAAKEAEKSEARALGLATSAERLDLDGIRTALGVALFSSGKFAEAEQAFRDALAFDPRSPDAHQNLGRMYAAQGRWPEAVSEFETARAERPGNLEDKLLLAQALETAGEEARAEALARELVDELPARAEPALILATIRLSRGEATEALSWIERALERDRRNGLAWYQKARALLLRNETQEAIPAFRNAVELAPGSFEAHYDFGAFLLNSGANELARPLLVRAYVLAPPEHRAALKKTLAELPGSQVAELLELAAADARRDAPDGQAFWLDRALALEPENPSILLEKARLLRRGERHDEALALWRKAADLLPRSFAVWSDLGAYLHQLGRAQEARPVLEHALELEVPSEWPPELRENAKQRIADLLAEPSAQAGG